MPISFAFFWAPADATSAACCVSIGTERVAILVIDVLVKDLKVSDQVKCLERVPSNVDVDIQIRGINPT